MAGKKRTPPSSRSAGLQEHVRQVGWTLLGLLSVGAVVFLPQVRQQGWQFLKHVLKDPLFWFGLCATLPSLLALIHRMLTRQRYAETRKEVLRWYPVAARHYAITRGRFETSRLFTTPPVREYLEQNRPGLLLFFLGALALAAPFLLLGLLAAEYIFPGLLGTSVQQAVTTGPYTEGFRGLVFAGYGVYVYTLLLIIHRLNAAALSSEFLLSAALRTLITLVLGLVAGQTTFIQSLGTENQSQFLYFILGAFPGWALQALRQRVHAIFQPTAPSQQALSLEYVDGINDQITERLEELGISDIQHLATTDPGELTLRTLYPLSRVIDWVDQAILITHLRDKIGVAREMGIRGAIDMRELFQDARWSTRGAPEPRPAGDSRSGSAVDLLNRSERAQLQLQELATRSGIPQQTLYGTGARLVGDYQVDFLAYLLNRRSMSWPMTDLVRAIRRALESSGLPSGGSPGSEIIPEGPFDARLLETTQVRERLREQLVQELDPLSLEWSGDIEELTEADNYAELYDMVLARITLKPQHEPSPPSAPSRGRRALLPRLFSRTH